MELIGYEVCRIVYLTNVARPAGGVYLPELAGRVIQQYSFLKFPNADDLQKETQTFAIGKFRDVQINELSIYGDGIIVSARADTSLMEAFISELFTIAGEFGLAQLDILEPEMHFESSVIVQSSKDLSSILSPKNDAASLVQSSLKRATGAAYHPFAIHFDADLQEPKTRRRSVRFNLERRIGLPFSKNIYYSQAPMRSADHLSLLSKLEQIAD